MGVQNLTNVATLSKKIRDSQLSARLDNHLFTPRPSSGHDSRVRIQFNTNNIVFRKEGFSFTATILITNSVLF